MKNDAHQHFTSKETAPKTFYPDKLFYAKNVHKKPNSFTLHWHDYYEICHVPNDGISLVVNDKNYPLCKDDIIIIAPHILHDTVNNSDRVQDFIVCQFRPEFLSDSFPPNANNLFFLRNLYRQGFMHVAKNAEECAHLISLILKTMDEPNDFIKDTLTQGCFTTLIGIFMQNNVLPHVSAIKEGFDFLTIRRYVEDNLMNGVSLKSIAALFNYEETYFSKKFKAVTGIQFKDFMQTLKLNRAQHLLFMENYSVNQVSELLGYANPPSFCRIYKETFGISPSQHKKQLSSFNNLKPK